MFWICNMYKYMCFLLLRAYGRKCYLACKLWCIHLYIYIYAFRPLSLLLHAELWEGRCKTICQNWQLFGGMNKEATHILHTKIRSIYLSSRRTKQVCKYLDYVGWVIGTNHWMYWGYSSFCKDSFNGNFHLEFLLGVAGRNYQPKPLNHSLSKIREWGIV